MYPAVLLTQSLKNGTRYLNLVQKMARRRSYARTRTVYRKARRTYRRSRGFGKGGMVGNIIDGAITGAIQGIIPDNALYGFGDTAAILGVGWFRKNATLQTIGGYQLGLKLASKMAGGQTAAGFTGQ